MLTFWLILDLGERVLEELLVREGGSSSRERKCDVVDVAELLTVENSAGRTCLIIGGFRGESARQLKRPSLNQKGVSEAPGLTFIIGSPSIISKSYRFCSNIT